MKTVSLNVNVNLSLHMGAGLLIAALGYLAWRDHQLENLILSNSETLVTGLESSNEKLDQAIIVIGAVAASVGNMTGDVQTVLANNAELKEILASEKIPDRAMELLQENSQKTTAIDAALNQLAATAAAGAEIVPDAQVTDPTDPVGDPGTGGTETPPTDTGDTGSGDTGGETSPPEEAPVGEPTA